MRKIWSDEAWEDYLYWQRQDKKTKKIESSFGLLMVDLKYGNVGQL